MRSLPAPLRLPSRRESAGVLGFAALVAVICWYFGVNVLHSLLLGCAVTVAALAALAGTSIPTVSHLGWRSAERRANDGSRNDVASLSTSLQGGWGAVGLTAERRVFKIARHRLALEGLDMLDPAQRPEIERRIGSAAYRTLKRSRNRRLRMRALIRALDALDAVDSTYYPLPQPRSRARGSRRIPSRPREEP